ncbi:signal peptide peptidase SppA [Candidatus Nanohalobium constans]|uniref:Protease IV n=1 Tax=Candidatus Nanohalobium constans TaxID=2565781 RepID=A0A5Q0UGG0_9ARCH|nr:signal peptide peptidase SppA [Candidatus Nanohalobium constans]QGA80733.1 protease IV [Candidatus Nanohalobium constans]
MKKLVLASVLLLLSAGASGFSFGQNSGKAALIDLSGTISSSSGGAFSTSGITPSNVRELNDQAVNQGADAVIYEINSGGGAIVASKEVYRDIEDVEVPTVCRMRDVAASGGYMISLGCDKVVADSASLTGSIGVRSSYLEYSGLLDKLGVEYVNISKGGLKGVASPYKNISDEERRVLQSQVDTLHENFVKQVESERNLSQNSTEEVSTSQPFLGEKAEELELVDELGGRDTAVTAAENLTGKNMTTFEVKSETSFSLLSLFSSELSLGDLFKSSSPLKASIF